MELIFAVVLGLALIVSWVYFLRKESAYKVEQALALEKQRTLDLLLATEKDSNKNNILQFNQMLESSKAEFQRLSQEVYEKQGSRLQDNHIKSLDLLLSPMKDRFTEFQKKIEDLYNSESRERFALKNELDRLMQTSNNLSLETQSLVSALKSNNKVQGDWGELILESILETSGLREGMEFVKQSTFEDGEGRVLRPDIVLQIGDNKHLIIDSKVSLLSLMEIVNDVGADSKTLQPQNGVDSLNSKHPAAKAFLESVQRHIKDLAEKHYFRGKGIQSPEFVFMFIPIEGAYTLLRQLDNQIWDKAWQKGVAIVSPSTLLPSLKAVSNVWKLYRQRINAQEIAQEAGKLYDKFVGFAEDFEKMGRAIDQAKDTYDLSINKLKLGPGNIIRRLEKIREMGAPSTKSLKSEWTAEESSLPSPE